MLVATLVGVVLAVSSYIIGVASFSVDITLVRTSGADRLSLNLGYLEQWNYGLWYLLPFLCPLLFAFGSLASMSTSAEHSAHDTWHRVYSLQKLGRSPTLFVVGWLLLLAAIGKNVLSEIPAYRSLGLGWVQAESLQRYRSEIGEGKPFDLLAAGKRFDQFFIPKTKTWIPHSELRQVLLTRVDPALHVRSHGGFLAFIVAVKTWVGVWEALAVYTAILILVWGFRIFETLRPELISRANDNGYDISWLWGLANYALLMGLLANIFALLRLSANAIKGSYGYWDKYWSLATTAPGFSTAVVGGLLLSRIHMFPAASAQVYFTRPGRFIVVFWLLSAAILLNQVLGYASPQQQALLLSLLDSFKELLKAMKDLLPKA